MINLDLKHTDFKGNEKWPLLFVIADIYFNYSSEDNPLLDGDLVKLAKSNYNLSIERHLIKKYRGFLSHYFGFEFNRIKKGYYITNGLKMITDEIKNNNCPDSIINFDQFQRDDETNLKMSVILSAIKRKRKIRLEIDNYVNFVSDYLMFKKHLEPLIVKSKIMIVTPLQIFIFSGRAYLLSFDDDNNQLNIHLLKTIKITKKSITKYKACENGIISTFDLKKYVEKQDFIVTGPIDENYAFKINKYFESYGEESIYITKIEGLKKPDMPSFLQSIIDLYGQDDILVLNPKISYFDKSTGQPIWDNNIEIVFGSDNRIESFFNRFKQCREISIDRLLNYYDEWY